MPAASVEVSIGSLLTSIIKNNFFIIIWVRPDNIAALHPKVFNPSYLVTML